MKRGYVILLALWASTATCAAQSGKAPADGINWSVAVPPQIGAGKKVTPKKDTVRSNAPAPSIDTEKAARIEEGRKKFFEQSSGFDNTSRWDKALSGGGGGGGSAAPTTGDPSSNSGGFRPGMGLNF